MCIRGWSLDDQRQRSEADRGGQTEDGWVTGATARPVWKAHHLPDATHYSFVLR